MNGTPAPATGNIAVVGLGVLGAALGRHLLHTGARVLGVDSDRNRRVGWEAATGHGALDAAGSLRGPLDAIFVVVPEPAAVSEVVAEAGSALGDGSAVPVFVLTTLSPDDAAAVGALGPPSVSAWPVPVSGGELAALRGGLLAIVPEQMPRELVALLRRTIARNVVVAPGPREAAAAKLVANALIAYQFAALDAVVSAGETFGADARLVYDVVRGGSAGAGAIDAVLHYAIPSLEKDLSLLAAPLPAVEASGGPDALRSLRRRLGASGGT